MVFHDHGNHILDPLLKPGFRHVFVCVLAKNSWIMVDPRNGVPVVEPVGPEGFDMAGFYRDQGFAVVEIERQDTPSILPFTLSSCVGAVKAIIGLRAPWVFTPHQLYRRLDRCSL